MNVLVAHGSKRGGTAEIARKIGESLRARGFEVHVEPARRVRSVSKYDAVLVGGALYAGRWCQEAADFVVRCGLELRARHVWFFSSGPLDDSASDKEIPPTAQVAELLAYAGANGHVTFGGRLAPDARGLVASAMAKTRAGDWRDMAQVEAWGHRVAAYLESGPARVPRPSSAFAPLPSRAGIVALCLLAGLPAVGGGASLMARPDGSLLRLPPSVLEHSPFHDFLVPGVLLLAVIGGGSLWSAVLHLRRSAVAPIASAVTGFALAVWIVVEMAMLRSFHPLQAAYLVLGVAIVAASTRSIRKMFAPPPGAEHPIAPHA